MPTEHFIAGKDCSLEASIERMQTQLVNLGFALEERNWLNPVDDVWSVHLVNPACPLMFTNGKGASQLAARASALGEFFERLSSNYFWSHYFLGEQYASAAFVHHPDERWFLPGKNGAWPKDLLTPSLQNFYNPEKTIAAEMLTDFNSGNFKRGICALPFVELGEINPISELSEISAQKVVYFPINILGNLYVSNGMSAGNSANEARAQALAEIIERHVKFRIISEGLCLPDVPEEILKRYPSIMAGIAKLRAAGFGVLIKDASLGGVFPVINVTLINPVDQGCFASFGAHPRFDIALERTLTELLQGRALDALGALSGFPEPGFDLADIASAPNLESHFIDSTGVISWQFFSNQADFEFCDWHFASAQSTQSTQTAQDYQALCQLINAQGYAIYLAESTLLGVYTCRIVVPGLSEIYPVDDLEYENNSFGAKLRPALLNLPHLSTEQCSELLATLDDSGIADQHPVAALIGLAPDADSIWADLRVGELRALLALTIGDIAVIVEACEWIRDFKQLKHERRRVYACIENLLKLAAMNDALTRQKTGFAPYLSALHSLYGAATVQQAQALINGTQRFWGLRALGFNLQDCQLHQSLLQAYEKVRRKMLA